MGEVRKNDLKPFAAAVLFSLTIGFSFMGIKTALMTADALQTLAWRFTFAFLGGLFGVILMEFKGKESKQLQERKRFQISGRLLLTASFYVGGMGLQALGLVTVTSIVSGILFAVVPIWTKLLAAIFLREKGNWQQNLFVVMSVSAVIAMFIFSSNGLGGSSLAGMIILIVASLLMAGNSVAIRSVRKISTPFQITLVITGLGCLVFNLLLFVRQLRLGTLTEWFAPLADPSFLIATLFLGIPSTLISSLLMAYMLAHMTAVKASMFGNLATAITVVAGVLFLKEPLGVHHIVCSILIIIGVAGVSATGPIPPEVRSEELQTGKQ
ncbi:MAG TPA: DMT family transporter [Clostridiales bacterium]|jgi:drug/metabolite transporter (DMT)-like permease|nr:DMT family transporter [Clostridiales bacterium]